MSARIILGIFILLLLLFIIYLFIYLFVCFDCGELTILVGNTVKVNTVVWMEILERF